MTFNIGSQSGGIVNNVQGDQRITGGQHGRLAGTGEARQALDSLRQALPAAGLTGDHAATAAALVTEMDAALEPARPDRPRLAHALERLTRLLSVAGSLARAGTALARPLWQLATWLGGAGEPVLRLLPALG